MHNNYIQKIPVEGVRRAPFWGITIAIMAVILGSAVPAMGQDRLGFGDNVSVQVAKGAELYCGRQATTTSSAARPQSTY